MRHAPMASLRECPYLDRVATNYTYRMPALQSRREFFRLPYPVTATATVNVDGTNYKVDEISERGLRVVTGVGRLAAGARFKGLLTLTAGPQCEVSGTVLRVDEQSFIVQLDKGPSCYDVIREQRHLTKLFPEWKPHTV
jgi:hypothetical protein